MATVNTPVSVGARREVPLQAPGTAVAAANTLQWDLSNTPPDAGGLIVVINVSALTSTPSVAFKIQGLDPVNNTWDILASSTVTTVSTTVLRVHPNLTSDLNAGAQTVAKDILPPRIRIQAVHGNANSITYSVTASFTY